MLIFHLSKERATKSIPSRTQKNSPSSGGKNTQEQRSCAPNHDLPPSNYRFSFGSFGTKVISVCGWRFAPACCAAQLVDRRGPGSTARLHAQLGPLNLAAPVGRIDASAQQKRNSSRFAPSKCSTLKAHAVPPNHSVNRTHCGVPAFGL